jgi:hypothetical protein
LNNRKIVDSGFRRNDGYKHKHTTAFVGMTDKQNFSEIVIPAEAGIQHVIGIPYFSTGS